MRLAAVLVEGRRRPAIVEGDRVLLGDGDGGVDALAAGAALEPVEELPLDEVAFDAPLRPPVLFCVGRNYAEHAVEAGGRHDTFDFFLKAGQTIAAPTDAFELDPALTTQLDYETELGVVVGRTARCVHTEDALDHVFGYVVVNDLSARDRQFPGQGRTAHGPGKNFDGATRLGAAVATADEVGDPQALHVETLINGVLRQAASTAEMIVGVAEIIARLSQLLTLHPGTIIATGTPAGTGLADGAYLGAGDVVTSSIRRVGTLSFPIIAAGDPPSPARPPGTWSGGA